MRVTLAQNRIDRWFATLSVFAGIGQILAAEVTLIWQMSSSTNVTGYNVYYGTISGDYTGKILVGNVATTTISNLDCGITYYFSATAFDSSGNESDFSNETRFLVPGVLALSTGAIPAVPMVVAPAPPNASLLSAEAMPAVPMVHAAAPPDAGLLSAGAETPLPLVIKFPVAPAHWYEVQATTDFTSWITIWRTGVATSNAWMQCSDPDANTHASRFYRLVLH